MRFKKVLSFVLVFGLVLSVSTGHEKFISGSLDNIFMASQTERDKAQNELDDVNNTIDNLENNYSQVESQLSEKAEQLSDLLADKAILEKDMKDTQAEIDQTQMDLESAKKEEEKSYELMKIRIRYMYENSTQDSIWDAILNASGITDLLNRVEYINQVHKTDRELLDEYKAIVEEIELLAQELDAKMNDMVALQEIYEHQEEELDAVMAELKADADDYQQQIAAAQTRAEELADYIEEQNRLIKEQERLAELARQEELKRQEELRKQQELEQQQQQNNQNSTVVDAATSNSDSSSNTSSNTSTEANTSTSGVTGEEIVSYAMQFVGNPYVWGGNSLTNGIDCSGFVNAVLKHFGFKNVPRYSQSFKYYGQAVSFENIQAGDIVVYPGHVAIYIGNGKIVEAQSSRTGITCTRSVTCSTITAIRRVV